MASFNALRAEAGIMINAIVLNRVVEVILLAG
jgi:hypothetical protein